MRLCDLVPSYSEAAALLKVAIEDANEELSIERDPIARRLLEIKIKDYTTARRQIRAVARVCEFYYSKPRDPTYTL